MHASRHFHTRRATAGAIALLATALLTGCGAGADDSTAATSGVAAPMTAPDAGKPAGVEGGSSGSSGTVSGSSGAASGKQSQVANPLSSLPLTGAQLVVTDALTVAVDNVPAAEERVKAIAIAHRGGVTAEDTQSIGGGSRSTLTVRLPNAGVDETEHAIAALGTRLSITRATSDVTDEVVDVTSRVESARKSLSRVQALYDRATKLSDIVSLEGEVARRAADLDSLLQRQHTLSGLTSLATVTVTLLPPTTAAPTQVKAHGFVGGFRSGANGLGATAAVVLLVIGAVLPFALVLALVAAPLAWLVRRRLHRAPVRI